VKHAGQTRKWDAAIARLLCGDTIKQAAENIRVSRRTMQNWLQDAEFKKRYREAKNQLMRATMHKLMSIGDDAVSTLHTIMTDEKANDAARVSACRTALDTPWKVAEIQELQEQITELERAIQNEDN